MPDADPSGDTEAPAGVDARNGASPEPTHLDRARAVEDLGGETEEVLSPTCQDGADTPRQGHVIPTRHSRDMRASGTVHPAGEVSRVGH